MSQLPEDNLSNKIVAINKVRIRAELNHIGLPRSLKISPASDYSRVVSTCNRQMACKPSNLKLGILISKTLSSVTGQGSNQASLAESIRGVITSRGKLHQEQSKPIHRALTYTHSARGSYYGARGSANNELAAPGKRASGTRECVNGGSVYL